MKKLILIGFLGLFLCGCNKYRIAYFDGLIIEAQVVSINHRSIYGHVIGDYFGSLFGSQGSFEGSVDSNIVNVSVIFTINETQYAEDLKMTEAQLYFYKNSSYIKIWPAILFYGEDNKSVNNNAELKLRPVGLASIPVCSIPIGDGIANWFMKTYKHSYNEDR